MLAVPYYTRVFPIWIGKNYVPGTASRVSVTYPRLHEEVSPGQEILIDDGLVAIRVQEIRGSDGGCRGKS